MKKRLYHGFGMALLLASPVWLTMAEQPNYLIFILSVALGICLLLMAYYTPASKPGAGS